MNHEPRRCTHGTPAFERVLWIKEVYLQAYESVAAARIELTRYSQFYNERRPHSSFGGQPPEHVYRDNLLQPIAA